MDTPVTQQEAAKVLTPREALVWAIDETVLYDDLNDEDEPTVALISVYVRDAEIARWLEAKVLEIRQDTPDFYAFNQGRVNALEAAARELREAE